MTETLSQNQFHFYQWPTHIQATACRLLISMSVLLPLCLNRQIFSPTAVRVQLGLYVKRQEDEKHSLLPCCRARRQETRCVKSRFERMSFLSSSLQVKFLKLGWWEI